MYTLWQAVSRFSRENMDNPRSFMSGDSKFEGYWGTGNRDSSPSTAETSFNCMYARMDSELHIHSKSTTHTNCTEKYEYAFLRCNCVWCARSR